MYLLYDEVSPFTANRRVLIEYDDVVGDSMMICMDTGYQSYKKLWAADSAIHEVMKETMPKLVWDTRQIQNDRVWYKLCLANAAVEFFPEMIGTEEYWSIYKLINGQETDSDIRRIVTISLDDEYDPENPNAIYLHRVLDVDNVIRFPITQFEEAFSLALESRVTEMDKLNDEINQLKLEHLTKQ